MFSNQQIETLPKHQTIQFQPLAENAIWQVQINWLLFYIPLMLTIIVVRHLNQGLTEAVAAPWLAILPVLVVIFRHSVVANNALVRKPRDLIVQLASWQWLPLY